jgi:acetyl/propionyl-CoA carboxylase alpha subunit
VDADGAIYFLEVNTRLQVEHPVTEMLTGMDLVRLQLEIALGGGLPKAPVPRGHAIEVRLNAEDPYAGFLPATGKVLLLSWPSWPNIRVDAGIHEGAEISPHYDLLLAKMIAWAPERELARRRLMAALRDTTLLGVATNQTFLLDLLERDFFKRGATFTNTIESESWTAPPVPEAALALAARELDKPREVRHEGALAGDCYSPWQSLGRFRVGP